MRRAQRFEGRLVECITFKWIGWKGGEGNTLNADRKEKKQNKNGLSYCCSDRSPAITLESVVSNGGSGSASYSYQPAAPQLRKWISEQVEDGGGFHSTVRVFREHTGRVCAPGACARRPVRAESCSCVCVCGRINLYFQRWYLQPRCISYDYICCSHVDLARKPSSLDARCRFIYTLNYYYYYFLDLSTPCCAFSLVHCVRLCKNLCALAELHGCAQTTLCVNSSLVVGGRGLPLCGCVGVCVYVWVDWWGHSRVPGLLTTSCLPLPCAPVPPSRRSVPSSFNLAAEAKESGERESPGDTARLQRSHSCLFSPLSSPCLFALPSLPSPPRSLRSSSPQFCLHFNFSRLPPRLSHTGRETERTAAVMQRTLSVFVLC